MDVTCTHWWDAFFSKRIAVVWAYQDFALVSHSVVKVLPHGRVDSGKVAGAILHVVLVFVIVVDEKPKLLQLGIGSDAHACLEQITMVLVEKR
jgi:hypothetical protein